MKIKSIAAVGAIGVGLGLAGFMARRHRVGRPPLANRRHPAVDACACRVRCQRRTWLLSRHSANPANQLGILINGTDGQGTPSGLGLKDQPSTFVNSVAGPGRLPGRTPQP